PYHIQEFANERTASKLRSAEERRLVAEARAGQQPDTPSGRVDRGHGFRIPLLHWEVRMHPTRPAGVGR
ncbi:MAG: hypothetical protein ACRDHY_13280, partial [Anaerolineales bacterium]